MLFETIPWMEGKVPVEMLAELTRVTVGKTEWAFAHHAPSCFRRARLGMMPGRIMSGRRPSMTRTMTGGRGGALCAGANAMERSAHTSAAQGRRFRISTG